MTDAPPPGCCQQGGNCPHCKGADLEFIIGCDVEASVPVRICPNCKQLFVDDQPRKN